VIGQGLGKDIFNEVFENHKDSGERITGRNLPFWHESLELAQRTVAVFPNIMFAGLDIAITAGGPVVIEMNVEPDPTAAITFDRSHAEIFACLK